MIQRQTSRGTVRLLLLLVTGAVPAFATDIEGVQAASMDQPRVTLIVRRTPQGKPLTAKADTSMAALLGEKNAPDRVATFAAFLDTGASGVSISKTTAASLGIKTLSTPQNAPIVFHDVGVGGSDQFHVSEPLYVAYGPYQALGGTVSDATFVPGGGPWNCQIGPLSGGGLLESLLGSIDVVGMPLMAGKVIVLDPKPVNTMMDVMRVQILEPDRQGKVNPPKTNRHVTLSYADFGPYTFTTPKTGTKPVTFANPFVGPGPVPPAQRVPPLIARHNGKSIQGGWLLDTGAAASMISTKQAQVLGIRYKAGTQGSGAPVLEGVPRDRQFTLPIGGIGGQKTVAGFYLDELRVPTREGDDLVYKPCPVLVHDITVQHPDTKQQVTLDGIFGMNLLVASAQITGGLTPDLGKVTEGPYDLVVLDHVQGVMGLELRKDLLKR